METKKVDWQSYLTTFPVRYTKHSFNDYFIEYAISNLIPGSVLDVGGGVYGTKYLQNFSSDYYLLDPFVSSELRVITWEAAAVREFDVIVARGSFNYLSVLEIEKLFTMLSRRGVMFFNTFENPKDVSREYSTPDSEAAVGIETSKVIQGKIPKIVHTLSPYGVDYEYRHEFWYYSPEFLKDKITKAGLRASLVKKGSSVMYMLNHV